MTNEEIAELLKPVVINEKLFEEREPIYLAISAIHDRKQIALIEIQKETFNTREMLKHENATAIEFVHLKDRYKKADKELSGVFAKKEIDFLVDIGIKESGEMMSIFKAVRQLREEGRLPINSPEDAYNPEKDLFMTRKTYESWGLPLEKINQVMEEYERLDKTMKHYTITN